MRELIRLEFGELLVAPSNMLECDQSSYSLSGFRGIQRELEGWPDQRVHKSNPLCSYKAQSRFLLQNQLRSKAMLVIEPIEVEQWLCCKRKNDCVLEEH